MYFIMIWNQRHDYASPIVNDNDEVMFYQTEDDAYEAMRGHIYAEAFGFEVFEMSFTRRLIND